MLPVTVLMLLLSARAGALGQRIGPRIPMTAGPVICAVALVLMSRIGAGRVVLAARPARRSSSSAWACRCWWLR